MKSGYQIHWARLIHRKVLTQPKGWSLEGVPTAKSWLITKRVISQCKLDDSQVLPQHKTGSGGREPVDAGAQEKVTTETSWPQAGA